MQNDIPNGGTNQHSLPTYADLQLSEQEFDQKVVSQYGAKTDKTEAQFVKEFLSLVNNPFPAKWLKKVKVGGGRQIDYAPIDKIEFLLTRVFGPFWLREIRDEKQVLNSMISRIRLHYKIPGTAIWLYQDGAGGSAIQVDANEEPGNTNSRKIKPSEINFLKSTGIQQAYPASVSFALSNAAEKIGELFGRGLNKDDAIKYDGTYDPYKVNVVATENNNGSSGNGVETGGVYVSVPAAQNQPPAQNNSQSTETPSIEF